MSENLFCARSSVGAIGEGERRAADGYVLKLANNGGFSRILYNFAVDNVKKQRK